MDSMQVVYAKETAPDVITKSIFLAGPTPRSKAVRSWRPDALSFLVASGYDGVVFVPEERTGVWSGDALSKAAQIEWEEKHLHMADCILFWVPREMTYMPALTTNIEWGFWQKSHKVVFGAPPNADHVKYLWHYVQKRAIPSAHLLERLVVAAMNMVAHGAARSGVERDIPLHIWSTPHFQRWYRRVRGAGNHLESAIIEWVSYLGPKVDTYAWILRAQVYNAAEQKSISELVIGCPDLIYNMREK